MTIGIIIFLIYVVAVVQMHYRGAVRFPWSRQLLTHTNYLAPYNLLMDIFSKLPAQPLLNVDDLDELQILRDNWQVIRDEALSLEQQGKIKASDTLNDVGFNSFFRNGWTRFYVKWYSDPLPSALQQCPKTVELLQRTPCVKAAMFASLPPGGELKRHRDPFAGSLRYHLGLVTPNSDDCYILVDGQRHSWRDGQDVLFDETYIHEAYNHTDQGRIILFCDVVRPLRSKLMHKINLWISDNIIKASATQNEASEKVGVINQAFGYLYAVRTFSKRIKKWNKPIYKTLKYGLFVLLVYAIFF